MCTQAITLLSLNVSRSALGSASHAKMQSKFSGIIIMEYVILHRFIKVFQNVLQIYNEGKHGAQSQIFIGKENGVHNQCSIHDLCCVLTSGQLCVLSCTKALWSRLADQLIAFEFVFI